MTKLIQAVHRWEPIEGIPETPTYDFAIESDADGQLKLRLSYSLVAGNDDRDMQLIFASVLAFRTHWDGDKPAVGRISDPPRCLSGPCAGFTWPLLIVKYSEWLASEDFDVSRAVSSAAGEESWRQFSVVAMQRSIDVIARGAVSATWLRAPRTEQ